MIQPNILFVKDFVAPSETRAGGLLLDSTGKMFDKMLHEAGILRTECEVAAVWPEYLIGGGIDHLFIGKGKSKVPNPKLTAHIHSLREKIRTLRPRVIVGLGELSLYALSGQTSIRKWRGSELTYSDGNFACPLIPTYAPGVIMSQWAWRFPSVIDLRRAKRYLDGPKPPPEYSFLIRPSFAAAMEALDSLPSGPVSCDIETRGHHIACIGFGTSPTEAFCIPIMCTEREEGYWSPEEEFALVQKMRQTFLRPDIQWVFQNGLYDCQYIARYWGVLVPVWRDTMLAHHVLFPSLQKGLDFLSSIYCDYHLYWKDEGKEWDVKTGEDQLWTYNCKDCCTTWEVARELTPHLQTAGLEGQAAFQMRQFPAVLRMMLRGVRCDTSLKDTLIFRLQEEIRKEETWINTAVGRPLSIRSPKQMQEFFFGELGVKPVISRKTGRPTTDDDALETIAKRLPVITPLISRIRNVRSLGVFCSTFAMMKLDIDRRIRCSYNIAGTETFRYSSSENAFGSGGNLQNIPQADSDIANIRQMFIPDPGYEVADADLDRADAQVVAWEANDDELKLMFRAGADIHLENARAIFSNPRLTKGSRERSLAKAGVHATNYGARPPTLARALGITVREADRFQKRWFAAHPGIADWHRRVEDSLATTRSVANRFGFRRFYFERIEGILPEALAWIPQSTVALVICHGLCRITEQHPGIHPLLQVHDSLVFQYPAHLRNPSLRAIRKCMLVEIPYEDPLTIPVGFKISPTSWGDCEEYELVD